MKITCLGHAGLMVETAEVKLLVDPWLSPYGAFQGSWFQYPDNHHLFEPSICTPTAVLISHEHLDHFDAWFLSQVPTSVPVVILRYPSPVLRRKVEGCGSREILEVGPWQRLEVGTGTTVFFVAEDSPMNHDAGVVVESSGGVLVNLNDARLSPAQLRAIRAEVGGHVDVLSLQAAGASWHPMCYEMPEDVKHLISRQKRAAKLSYAARAIKAVEPGVACPFAGPPCFLDPELFPHNAEMDGGIFPHQQQVADWLARRGVSNVEVLLPGDAWHVQAGAKESDATWDGFSFDEAPKYLKAYAARRAPQLSEVFAQHPEPTQSLWEPFVAYFEELLDMSPYFNQRIGMRVGFDITGPGGGSWAVDFRPGSEGVADHAKDCAYRYRFAGRWLVPLLDGTVPWEDFLLSLRFRAWRHPDVHNEHLLGLLKFADRMALGAVEEYETAPTSAERVTVHAEGRVYSVQRLCPHAGADLLDASEVLPGPTLRCLNHYYEFDLETGRCLNGMCPPLDVKVVEDLESDSRGPQG